MTIVEKIKNNHSVSIPIWVITILIPALFSLLAFGGVQIRNQQRILNTIEFHNEKIKNLETNKAYRIEVDALRNGMVRIEDKVDRILSNSGNF